MEQTIRPMELGDIFNRTFQLIGRTAVRALTIGVIALVPVAIIYGWALQHSLEHFAQFMRDITLLEGQQPTSEQMWNMLSPMMADFPLIALSSFAFMVGNVVAMIAVISVVSAEMVGEELTWKQALGETVRGKMWRGLGVQLLQLLVYGIIGAVCYVPFIVVMVGVSMNAQDGSGVAVVFLALMLFMMLLFGAIAFFFIRWLYTMQAIAWEDAGVIEAFKRSWELVKGRWWRTAIFYLALLIVSTFALSLITTPVQIFSMWGFFEAIMDMQSSMGERPDPSIFFEAFSRMGTGLTIIMALSSVLGLMIHPHYVTVMYFDARARNGEFEEENDGDYVNYME